ncbi:hypothetical protein A1O3_10174 [Capronia epimyces CBS 606.96]|uniref:Gfo/Idh/MocA-like oxidoreductase N-terminal domain-containing protein n=1 Tax=Capronia epimyces CBS 606.96 TaxID=1182542 RepID=W9X973_9EURO|nr:uncharacterized protein A1O3_10174 [Capronia epimyces CBS 606.96]EXJ77017.1 hypothetical protein A1O3_10174 [Capronia epimyces CBS 606.96]
MAPIRLGVVGLSAEGSWASRSHLPHLLQSDDYAITALQNSSAEAASRAVAKYQLPGKVACYGSISELVDDANVDMVVVSVKVPHHYELLKAALAAPTKKDVFVEWPLAANLREAEELTGLAAARGVRTMVGLQARQNPSIRRARELVASGALGDILGTTMLGNGLVFGPQVTSDLLYMLPIEHGANLLTIPAGHAIDALCYVLGEFKHLHATLANNRPELSLVDSDGNHVRSVAKSAHDYVAVEGTLLRGGVASVVYQGGSSLTGKDFYWEINGSKASLILEADSGHVQMFHPTLKLATPPSSSHSVYGSGPGPKVEEVLVDKAANLSYNVGLAWDAFVDKGPGSVTTFEDALVRHRMIDAIYKSNETGTRQSYL